jgi:pimeloyl-ACP methyl ester carboxylesterase
MPYVTNQGTRIHFDIEGSGPPIFLVHGFGLDGETWRDWGYVDALKDDYKLLIVDLRGHGSSDKPRDPKAYFTRIMAFDCISALDELNIEKVNFWGYSLGGAVGFRIAKYAPERLNSLILGGVQPYEGDVDEPNPYNWMLEALDRGIDAWVGLAEKLVQLTPGMKERLYSSDVDALKACFLRDSGEGFEDILPTMKMPCLIYVGEEDLAEYSGARKCASELSNARFISFHGLDHIATVVQSEVVLPHIKHFLEEVT